MAYFVDRLGEKRDPEKLEMYYESDCWFIRSSIHPALDYFNSGYNFAMRPEIFDKDDQLIENLEVEGGEAAVLSRIVAKPLQGWGDLDCPNPNYCPDELLREMISLIS